VSKALYTFYHNTKTGAVTHHQPDPRDPETRRDWKEVKASNTADAKERAKGKKKTSESQAIEDAEAFLEVAVESKDKRQCAGTPGTPCKRTAEKGKKLCKTCSNIKAAASVGVR
jgi:nucleoid-associated protein YgaU